MDDASLLPDLIAVGIAVSMVFLAYTTWMAARQYATRYRETVLDSTSVKLSEMFIFMDTAMLIGSRFEAGTEMEEAILNPKTGEKILDLPEASLGQIDAAVDAADKAFAGWSRTTPSERAAYLLKIADAIERDAEGFATLEALN